MPAGRPEGIAATATGGSYSYRLHLQAAVLYRTCLIQYQAQHALRLSAGALESLAIGCLLALSNLLKGL